MCKYLPKYFILIILFVIFTTYCAYLYFSESIKIDELIAAVRKLQNVPDECKIQKILKILSKIDNDKDGSIRLDTLLKVSITSLCVLVHKY